MVPLKKLILTGALTFLGILVIPTTVSAVTQPPQDIVLPSAVAGTTAASIDSTRCGVPAGKTALTYDDSFYGDKFYNIVYLAQHALEKNVGLYFFQLTEQSSAYKTQTGTDVFPILRARGQYIGNHTYNHANLSTSSNERIKWQINVGAPSAWLRPPGGASNAHVKAIANSLGRKVCTWTYDTQDWKKVNGVTPTGAQICQKVVTYAPKGSVILLHLNHKAATYAAMDCMINGLRAKGHDICRPYTATHPGVPTPVKLDALPC